MPVSHPTQGASTTEAESSQIPAIANGHRPVRPSLLRGRDLHQLGQALQGIFHKTAFEKRRVAAKLARWRQARDGRRPRSAEHKPVIEDRTAADFIDVKDLLAQSTVEQLGEKADAYFRTAIEHPDMLLAKPVASVGEAPELLISFGTLLRGLQPPPGSVVLDFGAGTCWTSRLLAQLRCRVIAMDISEAALEIGRQLFQRNPLFGETDPPQFQRFDGRRIDLAAESVDYIVCFDAFHHVPNPEEVLLEMGRVLRPGGKAAFSEPGPRHSRLPQSQFEMRNYGVIENDVVMSDVAQWAEEAGFDDLRLAIFDPDTYWCSPTEFESMSGSAGSGSDYLAHLRASLNNRRLFVLKKRGSVSPDSRDRSQLGCNLELIELSLDRDAQPDFVIISGACRAINTGAARWLPSDSEIGPVRLGARWTKNGVASDDSTRFPLPGDGVASGESCEISFSLTLPVKLADVATIEIDLVSEGITWFAINGSQPIRIWPPNTEAGPSRP